MEAKPASADKPAERRHPGGFPPVLARPNKDSVDGLVPRALAARLGPRAIEGLPGGLEPASRVQHKSSGRPGLGIHVKRAFVIGHPIAHSRSPAIHRYWLDHYGIEAGELYVNRTPADPYQGFHAGWKRSGLGGDDGKHGMLEFTQTRLVVMKY